jgi:glycerate dehydrogenase
MRIVVLDGHVLNPDDNPWDAVAECGELIVHARTTPEELLDRAAGADALLTNKVRLDAGVIEALPDLRFVSVLATGYDVVDVTACARRDIPVSNVPGYAGPSVAQHVFALIRSLTNRVALHGAAVKDGEWSGPDWCFWKQPVVELAGKTMGIVGLGTIGRRVAALAHALGMRVVAHAPRPKDPLAYADFAWLGLEELFATADVVSLHCPQTPDNAGFVNAELLGVMKPSALFINTARGGLVNEPDLAAALDAGTLAGAGLDVVAKEPIDLDNPLLSARNCCITPHIAWASLEARQRIMRTTAENIRAFGTDQPINVVNGV